jgi:hypothetical protein
LIKTTYTLDQLARIGLLSESTSTAILSGSVPHLSEVLTPLLTLAMDAHFMNQGDPKTSWAERRLSHLGLVNAFMLALLIDRTFGSGQGNNSGRPQQEIEPRTN